MVRGRRRRRSESAPSGAPLAPWIAAALAFLSMLSSTLLIPTVRPFFAAVHPGDADGIFWFMSVNMLGAIVGAPVIAFIADATGKRAVVLIVASVVDGALLFLCSLPLSLEAVLVLRAVQGAANVGALSLLMGLTPERGLPLAGGATVAAIAAGAPLGVLLLGHEPALPLQVGAMLPLIVAVVVGAVSPGGPARARGDLVTGAKAVLAPSLLVFAERFAIGLFIVPFSLLCHARGLGDAMVGRLYAAFLIPFAVATAIVPRTGVSPVVSVVGGAVVYAAALLGVGRIDVAPVLSLVLLVGGTAAAFVYAPALRVAARSAPAGHRGAAMGALNALGALGMLLGTAGAGRLSKSLMLQGATAADAWGACFDVGAVSLVVLVGVAAVPFARAVRANDEEDDADDDDGAEAGPDAAAPTT